MQIDIYPSSKQFSKCLVLVGGSGDTSEEFAPLVTELSKKMPAIAICTFNFSSQSLTESILDIQTQELDLVFKKLTLDYNFNELNIFATSMGSYSTIKLITSNKYSAIISRVIFYDPADYYLSPKFKNSDDVTWSGSQQYLPVQAVISSELGHLTGHIKVSVVHLTLRNYGPSGYLTDDLVLRGEDDPSGYPRLNTQMVKSFYDKTPPNNRGEYFEESNVPHAMLRDGNVSKNIARIVNTVVKIISKLQFDF